MWSKINLKESFMAIWERSDGVTGGGSWVRPQLQGFGNEKSSQELSILSNIKSIFLGIPRIEAGKVFHSFKKCTFTKRIRRL